MRRLAGIVTVGAPLLAFGCSATTGPVEKIPGSAPLVAVFPVENLSGRPAPLEDIRRLLVQRLKAHGLRILDDVLLEEVFSRHRVRYTAGVDQGLVGKLRGETGVEGILIPSLELYDDANPPRVALFARLVSGGDSPVVRWIDGTGVAGDDSPGLLGLGLVDDPRALLARSVADLARSLARHVSETRGAAAPAGPRKFRPKIVYRSELLEGGRTRTVAVVPFFNKTARKYAGEIMALHLMRNLTRFPGLEVVEPGVVREELLRYRIIMSEGISLPQTETVLNAVNADLVLNGEVLEYRDRLWPGGAPLVDFSVLFIERSTRMVVYSSYSHNAGDDRVFFFDVGKVNTAHAMAAEMARAVGERMLRGPSTLAIR